MKMQFRLLFYIQKKKAPRSSRKCTKSLEMCPLIVYYHTDCDKSWGYTAKTFFPFAIVYFFILFHVCVPLLSKKCKKGCFLPQKVFFRWISEITSRQPRILGWFIFFKSECFNQPKVGQNSNLNEPKTIKCDENNHLLQVSFGPC